MIGNAGSSPSRTTIISRTPNCATEQWSPPTTSVLPNRQNYSLTSWPVITGSGQSHLAKAASYLWGKSWPQSYVMYVPKSLHPRHDLDSCFCSEAEWSRNVTDRLTDRHRDYRSQYYAFYVFDAVYVLNFRRFVSLESPGNSEHRHFLPQVSHVTW